LLSASPPEGRVTVCEVARAAGVSRGTVYRYFAGIDDIAFAYLCRYYLCMGEGFLENLAHTPTLEHLKHLVYEESERSAALIAADPLLYIRLENIHFEQRGTDAYERFEREVRERLMAIVTVVCPDATRYRVCPEIIAVCLTRVLDHVTKRWSSDHPRPGCDIKPICEEASTAFVAVLEGLAC
jgi:AcrR family transcriptional regulator